MSILNNHSRWPHLKKKGNSTQLIVGGKPFIILGGEVHNSSSSSLAYMEPIWDKLISLNCNTAIVTVSWELFEPEEGKYDFSQVDGLIKSAREHGLKIIIIWFGTWKNSKSTYVPSWVKKNITRFPRMKYRTGQNSLTISCFSEEACKADARAFATLMKRIREIDEDENTVIMVQVENEVGFLGDSRDYSQESNKIYNNSVPEELMAYLDTNYEKLMPEIREAWEGTGRNRGSWWESFGSIADEVFMAWYIGRYVDKIAKAGKKEYPLPMFVNAWTVQYSGEQPGQYPSGGPVSRMLNIWHCSAPSIDILSPDIYLKDFARECSLYAHSQNPLFIPEARRDQSAVANVFYAIGKHDAIGFAPFGIESIGLKEGPQISNSVQEDVLGMDSSNVGDMFAKCYGMLRELSPIITQYQGMGQIMGVLQYGSDIQSVDLGRYCLRIKFNISLQNTSFPGGGLIIAVSDTEYIVAGHGFSVDFLPQPGDLPNVDFISIEEGLYHQGKWIAGRRLNGDEYSVLLGSEPSIVRASLYSYI